MKKIHQILLAKEDYFLIVDWLRTPAYRQQLGIRESEELENELKKAKLVSSEELPGDVVRLNSMVRIRDEDENREMELMLVTPDKADLRQRKISMLSASSCSRWVRLRVRNSTGAFMMQGLSGIGSGLRRRGRGGGQPSL